MTEEKLYSIYHTLSSSPVTEAFAALLDKYCSDLVIDLQNQSKFFTIWAPCTTAVEQWLTKDTNDNPATSHEALKNLVLHHISPHYTPMSVLQFFRNVPVLAASTGLNGELLLRNRPIFSQQVGPTFNVNFGATIIDPDVLASNGVIHVIDHIIPPPSPMLNVINALPQGSFSLLQSAIVASGFGEALGNVGCTFFAPTNAAFKSIEPKTLRWLLDLDGRNALRRLLGCHLCPDETLFSNRYYRVPKSSHDDQTPASATATATTTSTESDKPLHQTKVIAEKPTYPVPKGHHTFCLSSATPESNITVDINRWAGLTDLCVNKESHVISQDHMASNGVVHVVDRLLIPEDFLNSVDK